MPTAALGAFITYAVASTFFWHYPTLLHKKKKVVFNAMHISHRGGSAEGYENTIRNFKNAIARGTNMLELDVRLTKDEKVVVFHDPDLFRMTGNNIKISDIDYSRLPSFSKSVHIDTVPGAQFSDPTWTEDERRIPLLSQVLSQFPRVPMNIDIKDNDDRLIEKVSQMLNEHNRQEITVWGSFNDNVCQKLYKTNPEVCLFFSAKRVLVLLVLAITGILPFIPLKETHYEVFLPLSLKRRRIQQAGELSFGEKIMLWICDTFLVWKSLIAHLRNRGIHVYLWVCNSEDEYDACRSAGANGIMTDYPTKLQEYLSKLEAKKIDEEEKPLLT